MADKKSTPARACSSKVQDNGDALQPQYSPAAPQAPLPPTQSSYDNIPAELRALPQWVAANSKKEPINPHTGRLASPTDPGTWGTFEQACASGLPHIGFVFSKGDPYFGIDLDHKAGDEAERRLHGKILDQFDTYTERSTNGEGYHIIGRGTVGPGRRRDSVEVYSEGRYFIFTGNVHKAPPLVDCQHALNDLVKAMPEPAAIGDLPDGPETRSDREITATAERATNGDKFRALCTGQWHELGYPSQSEADEALLSMLCFYSPNNAQVRRMFRDTTLGQRGKATRNDYLNRSIARARAEQAQRQVEDAAFIAGMREDVTGWLARAAAKARADRWLVPTSELRVNQKPVAWHIKRWLQAEALIMVHGPSGAGKTFLVIDWCMHIANGMPDWLGNRVKSGSVVYLAGEGHKGLRQRLQAWAVHHGTAGKAEDMAMSRSGCDLDSQEGLARVIDAIRSSGVKPCLIVVDTLHRFMRGDENTAKDAGAMIANCDALKQEFGCSVLLVHHTGNAAEAQHRARGSSAWRGALDVEIGVQPPPAGESAIVVSLLKMRDADPVPPVCVKLQRVDLPGWVDEDGEQVSSAVLVEGGSLPQKGHSSKSFDQKKGQWRSAWLAYGSTHPRGDHHVPYLSRAGLKQWLEKNTELTQVTIESYLKPSTKAGTIGMLLDKGWLEAHGDGWLCLDAADSSTMLMMRNAGAGRAKVGAP
ncbi:AAA family ATPase [Dyella sp.]|uniref:AAA family ATPase n=1 Tax=Dyella sp. TaxID=1869338 RepID=UPI003F7E7B55